MALRKASGGALGSLTRCFAWAMTAAPSPATSAASHVRLPSMAAAAASLTLPGVRAFAQGLSSAAARPSVRAAAQRSGNLVSRSGVADGSSAGPAGTASRLALQAAGSGGRRGFSGWGHRGSGFSLWRGHGGDAEQAVYPLIAANAAVYLLWQTNLVSRTFMTQNFTLTTSDIREGRLLNLVTCVFSHTDLMHLVFNMFGLYSFGTAIGHLLGPRRMLNLYLIGGLVGSATHVGLNWNPRASSLYRSWEPHLLGASGAVYTLLSLYVCMFPKNTILIFGIVPVPGWMFGLLYMGYDLSNLRNQSTGISHASHVGGAVTGLAFYLMLRRGRLPF